MQSPTPLNTEQLVLKVPEPRLAAELARYHSRNHARFAPYAPLRSEGYHSEKEWVARAREQKQASERGVAAHWLLFEASGDPSFIVGDIHLTGIQRGALEGAYLGYQLDAAAEGRGLMSEALRAVLDDAFQRLGLHRIMANYVPTNERSGRLLRRLGFVVEGYARDYLYLEGKWKDHVLTAVTNPAWQAPGLE